MTECDRRADYLAQVLNPEARAAVEAHLPTCSACRAAVQESAIMEENLRTFLRAKTFQVSPFAARSLPKLAQARRRETRTWLYSAALGGMAVAVFALFMSVDERDPERAEEASSATAEVGPKLEVLLAEEGKVSGLPADSTRVLEVSADGRLVVRAGADVIGVGARSQAEVLAAPANARRIRLVSGVVAVQAARRAPGESLSVQAGGYSVRVVGTRFVVAWDGVARLVVGVSEGVVSVVDSDGGERNVRQGQQITLGENHSGIQGVLLPNTLASLDRALDLTPNRAPQSSSPASQASSAPERQVLTATELDDASIRQLILKGAYAEAESALLVRVKAAPRDASAWWLLGECRRKVGENQASVAAYRRVVEMGSPAEQNRARYQAALLLQDRLNAPAAAMDLYRSYIAAPAGTRPLEASAQLRLGRALAATGNPGAAREAFGSVQRRYPGTPEAEQAKRALQGLARP